MTDDYWKKRAAELAQQHHEPAHKTQGKSLEDVLNGVPGLPPQPGGSPHNNGEIDMNAVLAQRLAGHMQTQGMPGQAAQPPQQAPQVVFVKEGVRAYRRLEAEAYGTTTPLARLVGPMSGVGGKQFEFKGMVNAYVVEGNSPVDMGNIDPSRMKQLAVISAPFVGTLLVPESAVFGPRGPQRQVLKG